MSVEIKSVKCPECGASITIGEGRDKVFCSYCGSQILVSNENEHIYRHIDEAEMKKAETDRIVRTKRLEMLDKQYETSKKAKSLKIKVCLVLAVITVLFLFIGSTFRVDAMNGIGSICGIALIIVAISLFRNKDDSDITVLMGEKVRIPRIVSDCQNKNYATVEAAFISAGFTNVRSVPLNDLTLGLMKKPGMVQSISVNGKEVTFGGRKCSPNSMVVISYHSR